MEADLLLCGEIWEINISKIHTTLLTNLEIYTNHYSGICFHIHVYIRIYRTHTVKLKYVYVTDTVLMILGVIYNFKVVNIRLDIFLQPLL